MVDAVQSKAEILADILGAIEGDLSNQDATDVRSFIAAGEYGLAADTLFSALAAHRISLDEKVIAQLAAVEDLYNTFGDLDPEVSGSVLRREHRPTPVRL